MRERRILKRIRLCVVRLMSQGTWENSMTGKDAAIPIAYPDYLITVDTPRVDFNLPHLPRGIDLFPSAIHIKGTHNKVPDLGHAGILFFSGTSGTTKYYEYGRYDIAQVGLTRRVPMPNLKIVRGTGRPTRESFQNCVSRISQMAGQHGRIEGAYIELPAGKFAAMLAFCQKCVGQNSDPQRQPYSLTSHSCVHFAKEVLEAAGVSTPLMIDPRPIGYVEKLQGSFPAVTYRNKSLSLSGIALPSAKPLIRHADPHRPPGKSRDVQFEGR